MAKTRLYQKGGTNSVHYSVTVLFSLLEVGQIQWVRSLVWKFMIRRTLNGIGSSHCKGLGQQVGSLTLTSMYMVGSIVLLLMFQQMRSLKSIFQPSSRTIQFLLARSPISRSVSPIQTRMMLGSKTRNQHMGILHLTTVSVQTPHSMRMLRTSNGVMPTSTQPLRTTSSSRAINWIGHFSSNPIRWFPNPMTIPTNWWLPTWTWAARSLGWWKEMATAYR